MSAIQREDTTVRIVVNAAGKRRSSTTSSSPDTSPIMHRVDKRPSTESLSSTDSGTDPRVSKQEAKLKKRLKQAKQFYMPPKPTATVSAPPGAKTQLESPPNPFLRARSSPNGIVSPKASTQGPASGPTPAKRPDKRERKGSGSDTTDDDATSTSSSTTESSRSTALSLGSTSRSRKSGPSTSATTTTNSSESGSICDLSRNRLDELPKRLFHDRKIGRLHAGGNNLFLLPMELTKMTHLRELVIPSNQFREFPRVLLLVTSLTTIDMSRNKISTIPFDIDLLFNLARLKLNRNKLKTLPVALGNLSELEVLDVSSNRIKSLPSTIGNCIKLRQVSFATNLISEWPTSITNLTNLETMLCHCNHLVNLPTNIRSWKQLKRLNFSDNKIADVPFGIKHLTKLDTLKLALNRIIIMPPGIGRLTNLVVLVGSRNRLSVLPKHLDNLANLEQLDFAHNLIDTFPGEICRLTKLKRLSLAHNRLQELPADIAQFEHVDLNLADNKIWTLPYQMGTMKFGEGFNLLHIENNPFGSFPEEIRSDPSAILRFFRQLRKKTAWRRVKLVLVGEELVGKTSLKQQLTKNANKKPAQPHQALTMEKKKKKASGLTDDNVATDGIEIDEWEPIVDDPNNRVFFSCWDFAGQDIYLTSHQFFLTKMSVCIIVFNMMDEKASKVEYWLKTLKVRANGAPVVIVGTHRDDKRCDKKYRETLIKSMRKRFDSRFPFIRDYVCVSCKNGKGIEQLVSVLIDHGSKFANVEVPQSYIFLEGRLRLSRLQKQVMHYKDFCNYVKDCGVSDKKLKHCLEFMNDAGVIVYFDDATCGLNELVILDPQWIIDLLSSIITLKHSYAKDGILPIESLPQIWREYPREEYEWLLRLLEKFEISFRVDPIIAAASGINRGRSASDADKVMVTADLDKLSDRGSSGDLLPRSNSGEMKHSLKRSSNPDLALSSDRSALDSKAVAALDLPCVDVVMLKALFRGGRKRSNSDSDSIETSNSNPDSDRTKPKSLRGLRHRDLSKGYENDPATLSDVESPKYKSLAPASPETSSRDKRLRRRSTGSRQNNNGAFLPIASDKRAKPKSSEPNSGLNSPASHSSGPAATSATPLAASASSTPSKPFIGFSEGVIIVPSLLPAKPDQSLLQEHWESGRARWSSVVGRRYKFKFLPLGFFGRLIVRTLHLPKMRPLYYWKNGIIIEVPTQRAMIEYNEAEYQLELLVKTRVAANSAAPAVSDHSLMSQLIENIETLIIGWYMQRPTVVVPCSHCLAVKCLTADPVQEMQVTYSVPKVYEKPPQFIYNSPTMASSLPPDMSKPEDDHVDAPTPVSSAASVPVAIPHPPHIHETPDDEGESSPPFSSSPPIGSIAAPTLVPGSPPDPNADVAQAASPSESKIMFNEDSDVVPFYFPLEECLLAVREGKKTVTCIRISKPEKGIYSKLFKKDKVKDAKEIRTPVEISNLCPDIALTDVENLAIDFASIDLGNKIAEGSYATLYKGRMKSTGKTVAVKVLKTEEGQSNLLSESWRTLQHETFLMKELKHPNLVELLGICVKPLCMIMNFFELGSLNRYLHDGKAKPFTWKYRVKVALDIAQGMSYLHNEDIIHRDLRSPNILVSSLSDCADVVAKVADFGLSVICATHMAGGDFNELWTAPEIFKAEKYTLKVDQYSYGIILWELLQLGMPFQEFSKRFSGKPRLDFFQAVIEGLRPTIPITCPKRYASLIQKCWALEPDARPTFATIVDTLQHMLGECERWKSPVI